ncbi:hypothetical protein [Chloroflexus sp.]|uniref:hypothetical protein n=1 Tax=Chloroflexus sp. TaxID=1904827 RepID=UPI003C72F6A4
MHSMPKRPLITLAVSLLLTITLVTPITAQPPRPIPKLDALRLDEPVTLDQAPIKLSPSLINVTGRQSVVIRLSGESNRTYPTGCRTSGPTQPYQPAAGASFGAVTRY